MISVAMSTYNGEQYIKAQLDSIYDQELRPDEVIIVDDCSKDNTVEVVRNYIKDKSEIIWRIYSNESNQGYVKNFFQAIEYCKGDIIILCDQDDVWTKDKVLEIQNTFNNPAVLSYHSEIDIIDQDDKVIRNKAIGYKGYNVPYSAYDFLHRLNYCGMSSAFRSSLKADLSQINPENLPTHDWVIHALASVKGGLYISNKVTTYRRYHVDNAALILGKTKREKINQRIKVVENYNKYYDLYFEFYEKFGLKNPKVLNTVNKYRFTTSERIEYLKNRSFVKWIKSFGDIRYYSSLKAYLCDLFYMCGVF